MLKPWEYYKDEYWNIVTYQDELLEKLKKLKSKRKKRVKEYLSEGMVKRIDDVDEFVKDLELILKDEHK